MCSRHGPVTEAFGILSSKVWNLDVWAQQALFINGEAA